MLNSASTGICRATSKLDVPPSINTISPGLNNGITLVAICCFPAIPVFSLSVNSTGIPDRAMAPPCTLVNKPSSSNSAKSRRKVSSDTPSSELNAVM